MPDGGQGVSGIDLSNVLGPLGGMPGVANNQNNPTPEALASSSSSNTPPTNAPVSGGISPQSNPDGDNITPTPQDAIKQGADAGFTSIFDAAGKKLGAVQGTFAAVGQAGQQIAAEAMAAAKKQADATIAQGQVQAQLDAGGETAAARQAADEANQAIKMGAYGPSANASSEALKAIVNQSTSLMKTRTDLNSVGFFNDPIHYLFNQMIGIPLTDQRLKNVQENLKTSLDASSALAQKQNVYNTASAAVDTVHSTQRAGQLATRDLLQAQKDAQDPIIKAAQQQLAAYGLVTSSAGESVRATTEQANIPLKQEQTDWYSTSKNLQGLELQAKADALRANVERINNNVQETQAKLEAVNKALAMNGMTGISNLGALPKSVADGLSKQALFGNAGGANPAEALDNLVNKIGIPVSSLPGAEIKTAQDIQHEQSALAAQFRQVNPTAGATAINQFVNEHINQSYQNRNGSIIPISDDPAKPDLLFKPAPLSTLVDTPWGKTNPVIQNLLPDVTDGNGKRVQGVPATYERILNSAASLIKEGKLTEDQAVNYSMDVPRNALKDNDAAYGFKKYVIPVSDWQDPFNKYQVNLPRPGALLGGNSAVDLFNKAAVTGYLRKLVAIQEAQPDSFGNK